MTLDEAIAHCLEVAEQNEAKALRIGRQFEGTLLSREAKECRECAADHRQLAEWLRELKKAKKLLKEALIIAKIRPFCDERYCDICKNVGCELGEDCFEWKHEDEVLALIGKDTKRVYFRV